MHNSTWKHDNKDLHTALDDMAPSTRLEQMDLSRPLRRKSISVTRVAPLSGVVKVLFSTIKTNISTVPQALTVGIADPLTISNSVLDFTFGGQVRVRKLQKFLDSSTRSGQITDATRRLAWLAWTSLAKIASRKLLVPDAGIGPDGQVLFSWNRNDHHFEIEIFPSGLAEIFYLNFETDEVWEGEYRIGDSFPLEISSKLPLFLIV